MLIAWIVFGISLSVMLIVLARRFRQAAVLDVETIASERQKAVKEKLAHARLQRGAKMVREHVKKTFAPMHRAISSTAQSLYGKVLSLEKKYQEERRAVTRPLKEEEKDQVSELLAQGQKFLGEGRYGEAEQTYIKVIGFDARSIPSYRGLAKIYLETKQLDQAKETLDFLLKLKPGDAESFAMRSEVAYARGDLHAAEEEMQKATEHDAERVTYTVDLAQILYEAKKFDRAAATMRGALAHDENNPKYLDFLVDACILSGDARGAETALERLKAVNPENQKIAEFEGRVAGMGK